MIDPAIFNVELLSIGNLDKLDIPLREYILQYLPNIFRDKLYEEDSKRKYANSKLEEIENENYDDLYQEKYKEYYEAYKKEKGATAKDWAKSSAKAYVSSYKKSYKSSVANSYKSPIKIQNILEKSYNDVIKQYIHENEEEQKSSDKLI